MPRPWPPRPDRSPRSRASPFLLAVAGGDRDLCAVRGDRLADDPDLAWRVLQHVGNGAPDREIAPEALAIRQPDDEQVGLPLRSLVDQRRADLTRLEQHRFEAGLAHLRLELGVVEDLLGLVGARRDV